MSDFVISKKVPCKFCKNGKNKSFCPDCNGIGFQLKAVDLVDALEELGYERRQTEIRSTDETES